MPNSTDQKIFPFHRPGKYRIRVIGCLDESWSSRLGGFSISTSNKLDEEESVAELVGQVRDQSELSGILETLYDLHMTILLVQYLDE